MFTHEEALNFVEKDLKIGNPSGKFKENRLAFLNSVIRAYHYSIPFQNITLLCHNKDERRAPSIEEMKEDTEALIGGICLVNNVALKFILESVGYDVVFIPACVANPDDHCLFVVNNVISDGDQFMVDVGSGYPTFQAIPLDFEQESPVYSHSFCQYKFLRNGDVIERHIMKNIRKLTKETAKPLPQNSTCKWTRCYDFKLTPVDYSYYDTVMHGVYTIPGTTPFLVSLRVVSFLNGRCVALRDRSLLTEQDDKCLHETKLESLEEMKQLILKLCPQIQEVKIDRALHYWEKEIMPTLK